MVFYNHDLASAPKALPRYLDLGYYAAQGGMPFTQSSNLLYALQTALTRIDWTEKYAEIAEVGAWLRNRLDETFDGPTVVVTHHSPTPLSNEERYRDDLLSAAFVSDVSALMSGAKVKLWIHGHTHHCADLDINGTRVVSNQRGYHPSELVARFDPGFVVEV